MTQTRGAVLIVDHDEQRARLLERALSAENDVTFTTKARAAASLIADGHLFDLILCDLEMTDMSAIDFHEVIFQRAPALTTCVVFLTGGHLTPEQTAFLDDVPNVRLQRPVAITAIRDLMRSRQVEPTP